MQVEADWLAEELSELQVGVGRERGEVDAVAGVFGNRTQGFVDAHGFGEQYVGTGRGGQGQQAVPVRVSSTLANILVTFGVLSVILFESPSKTARRRNPFCLA